MDRRSWPWKKKTSEKSLAAADAVTPSLPHSEKDDLETDKYAQISVESYTHLSQLEDQVTALSEKLSSVQSEMTVKEDLVKQHAKVAEEAVSGWEKAEAESLTLKQQLESITLQKLTAEERSSHLDSALKECMKKIRNVKEDGEKKLHDVIFTKTKQWERVEAELKAKIIHFEQELLKASAENSALSRSLQERSSLLMKISEEKSQADAQIEVLKNHTQSCEREINSMKYELHVVAKELEIRNEEKNMSMRSTEVANKQHLEDVKKITKLEAECQRLRGLVRKKLPGPAAIAQMKMEVENLGREHGENRVKRSPGKGSNPHHASAFDFRLINIEQVLNENEFLTARLLAMEEETKMLKEALSNRNSELKFSRKICSKQANKIRSMEAHVLFLNHQKNPSKSSIDIHFENESNPSSLTSVSEDGIDEETSCSDSWANTHFKKDKDVEHDNNAENSSNSEVIDDFLEMERLASLSTECKGTTKISDGEKSDNDQKTSADQQSLRGGNAKDDESTLLKLKSRLTSIFDSESHETSIKKILEDIEHIIRVSKEELPQHYFSTNNITKKRNFHKNILDVADIGIFLNQAVNPCTEINSFLDQELKTGISYIHGFLLSLKEDAEAQENRPDENYAISNKLADFSDSINCLTWNKLSLRDFILHLADILREASDLRLQIGPTRDNERGNNSPDCIDKETLLENKIMLNEPNEVEASTDAGFGLNTSFPAFSSNDFVNMKMEKDKLEMDLATCKVMLDQKNSILVDVEKQLAEMKTELATCQKSYSLADTQLRCMAESYKILESQKDELESEISFLRAKAETLDNQLQEERHYHQEDLVKYKELQEQIERNMKSLTSSFPCDADDGTTQQGRDITAAAEKLAECQETILLLSKQLNAMRNPSDHAHSNVETNAAGSKAGGLFPPPNPDESPTETIMVTETEQLGEKLLFNGYNSHMCLSDTEQSPFRKSPLSTKDHKQKVYRSSSSSSPSTMPNKHSRGFRRLFSRGKSDN